MTVRFITMLVGMPVQHSLSHASVKLQESTIEADKTGAIFHPSLMFLRQNLTAGARRRRHPPPEQQ